MQLPGEPAVPHRSAIDGLEAIQAMSEDLPTWSARRDDAPHVGVELCQKIRPTPPRATSW